MARGRARARSLARTCACTCARPSRPAPLSSPALQSAVVALERLFAWCALDILVLSTVAATSQMSLVAQFAIKNELSFICEELLPSIGGECIELDGQIGLGGLWLACAAVLLAALAVFTRFYLKGVHRVVNTRVHCVQKRGGLASASA